MLKTTFFTGIITASLFFFREGFIVGMLVGVIVGLPFVVYVAVLLFPAAAVIAILPWIAGHTLGQYLRLEGRLRGALAAVLAGSTWAIMVRAIVPMLPSNQRALSNDEIVLPSFIQSMFDIAASYAWLTPIVGVFVAIGIYNAIA